jgi:hypothetical protein
MSATTARIASTPARSRSMPFLLSYRLIFAASRESQGLSGRPDDAPKPAQSSPLRVAAAPLMVVGGTTAVSPPPARCLVGPSRVIFIDYLLSI